ncbi:MAG: hypothetical protein K6F69_04005 [Treponema sp.]|nr:hypothetical protein [Treponema sp.]
MKKLVCLLATAILAISAFAENIINLGAYIPTSKLTLSQNNADVDVSNSGIGGFVDITHIADSGFTFKIGAGIGKAKSDLNYNSEYFDIEIDNGYDVNLFLGLGCSFINNGNFKLSLTGNLGFTYDDFSEETSYDITAYLDYYEVYLGPELYCTYLFNEKVGLFADLGIYYNIGSGSYGADYNNNVSIFGYDFDVSGVSFLPKFGLSISL